MDCVNLCRSRLSIGNTVIRLYRQPERPAVRTQPPTDRIYAVHRYPLQMDQPRDVGRQDLAGIRRYGWYKDGRIDESVGPGQTWCVYSPV